MSYARYLWTVAETLRRSVRGAIADEAAAATLQNCVNVLAAMANSLDRGAAPPAGSGATPSCVVRDARGLPDNPAYQLSAVGFIDLAVADIRSGEATLDQTRDWTCWETGQSDAAVRRMDAVAAIPSDTRAASSGDVISIEALETYLRSAANAPDLRIVRLRHVIGGRSRQTALFEIVAAPGLPSRMVVQRGIPGMAKGAAFCGPEIEYHVLAEMHRIGMCVPRPLLLERGSEALGAPFLVVEQSAGRIVEPDYWAATASRAVALQLARQLALLHSADPGELAQMLPRARSGSDVAALRAELSELEQAWRSQVHGACVAMEAAIGWLRANVECVSDRLTLVHNDMVFHNILAENDEITAILDWEQAAMGHPAEDVGYCYPVVSRVIDWNEFVTAYRDAGGPPLSLRECDYFSLRALLRLTVLVQHGRDAFEQGLAPSIVVAEAGAFFLQRLMRRLGEVVDDVLTRSSPAEQRLHEAAA